MKEGASVKTKCIRAIVVCLTVLFARVSFAGPIANPVKLTPAMIDQALNGAIVMLSDGSAFPVYAGTVSQLKSGIYTDYNGNPLGASEVQAARQAVADLTSTFGAWKAQLQAGTLNPGTSDKLLLLANQVPGVAPTKFNYSAYEGGPSNFGSVHNDNNTTGNNIINVGPSANGSRNLAQTIEHETGHFQNELVGVGFSRDASSSYNYGLALDEWAATLHETHWDIDAAYDVIYQNYGPAAFAKATPGITDPFTMAANNFPQWNSWSAAQKWELLNQLYANNGNDPYKNNVDMENLDPALRDRLSSLIDNLGEDMAAARLQSLQVSLQSDPKLDVTQPNGIGSDASGGSVGDDLGAKPNPYSGTSMRATDPNGEDMTVDVTGYDDSAGLAKVAQFTEANMPGADITVTGLGSPAPLRDTLGNIPSSQADQLARAGGIDPVASGLDSAQANQALTDYWSGVSQTGTDPDPALTLGDSHIATNIEMGSDGNVRSVTFSDTTTTELAPADFGARAAIVNSTAALGGYLGVSGLIGAGVQIFQNNVEGKPILANVPTAAGSAIANPDNLTLFGGTLLLSSGTSAVFGAGAAKVVTGTAGAVLLPLQIPGAIQGIGGYLNKLDQDGGLTQVLVDEQSTTGTTALDYVDRGMSKISLALMVASNTMTTILHPNFQPNDPDMTLGDSMPAYYPPIVELADAVTHPIETIKITTDQAINNPVALPVTTFQPAADLSPQAFAIQYLGATIQYQGAVTNQVQATPDAFTKSFQNWVASTAPSTSTSGSSTPSTNSTDATYSIASSSDSTFSDFLTYAQLAFPLPVSASTLVANAPSADATGAFLSAQVQLSPVMIANPSAVLADNFSLATIDYSNAVHYVAPALSNYADDSSTSSTLPADSSDELWDESWFDATDILGVDSVDTCGSSCQTTYSTSDTAFGNN